MSAQNRKEFQDDSLWEVLGRSGAIEPGPFFTQETLRAARRTAKQPRAGLFPSQWRAQQRALAAAACALALLLCGLQIWNTTRSNPPRSALPSQHESTAEEATHGLVAEEDVQLIEDLDILLALEESSLWTEVF
jgi:hypothetical protein